MSTLGKMGLTPENDPSITPENNKPSSSKLVPRSAGKVRRRREPEVAWIQAEKYPTPQLSKAFTSRPSSVREFRIDLSLAKWPHLSKSLATTTRLHTSELMNGEIELEVNHSCGATENDAD